MVFLFLRTVSMVAVYQLKMIYDQDKFGVSFLDAKRLVSFSLEDKHVNECRVIRKSDDATGKNAFTLCVEMHRVIGLKQTHGIKNVRYSEGGKKFVGVAVYLEE